MNDPNLDSPSHIEAYDYELPESLIAQEPLGERDVSRLLAVERASGKISHHGFRDLMGFLRAGDLLVINETRVLPARLYARRPSGGSAELLLVRPSTEDRWLAMVRPSARIRPGTEITIQARCGGRTATAVVEETAGEGLRLVRFPDGDVEALIAEVGEVPLPPYIRRPASEEDRETYQTVYARVPGAVAAPTAGLHFTTELLEEMETRNVRTSRLVLHVGPGTFRPVQVSDYSKHRLEAEWCEIPEATAASIRSTKQGGGRVVAVGTTTTRALEAAARLSPGGLSAYRGWVDLFIYPPFEFRVVDALITNFHLPKSSLLLLVSAFGGRHLILEAYGEAVREKYRFYSYGDAMLIL
jgi:S-adenosylmethionine:tRNA ribosyltransferase-isomerase